MSQVKVSKLPVVHDYTCVCVCVQINYSGAEASPLLPPSCMYIYDKDLREQKAYGSQDPCLERLDGIIADKELTAKQKKKLLKQVCHPVHRWFL